MATLEEVEKKFIECAECNNYAKIPLCVFQLLYAYGGWFYDRYELCSNDPYTVYNDPKHPHSFENKWCNQILSEFPAVRGLDPRDNRNYALCVALYEYGTVDLNNYEKDYFDEIFNHLVKEWKEKEALLDLIDQCYNGSLEEYITHLEKTRLEYVSQLDNVGVSPIYFFSGCVEYSEEEPMTLEVREKVLKYQRQPGGLVDVFDQNFEAVCEAIFKKDWISTMYNFIYNSNMYFLCRITFHMYMNNIILEYRYDWCDVIDWCISRLHKTGYKHEGSRFSKEIIKIMKKEIVDYFIICLPAEEVKKLKDIIYSGFNDPED